MHVEAKSVAALRVAYLRAIGPYQQEFPKLWPKFCELAAARGLFKPGAQTLSLCHDNPKSTPPEQLRGDACITVDDAFGGDDVLKVQTIDGGRFAVADHVGPYASLPQSYHVVFNEWIPGNGQKQRNAPSYEIYVSDPRTTPQEQLLTQLYVPIE